MAEIATLGLTVDATGVVRGVGIATRELDRLGGRSDQAKLNVKGLQGALGSLATAAIGLPGPLGRVGQILGSFALGGGMMIAVTAGVAAVGAAWQALSRDADEARRSSKAMADQLMSDSRRLSDFSRAALQVRQATLEARRDELAKAIANQGKPTALHPDLNTAAGRFAFGAADAATKATFFFPTVKPEDAERLYEYDRALREVTRAIQALDRAAKPKPGSGGSRSGRLVELGPDVTDVELARAFAKHLADAATFKQKLMAGVVDTSGFGFQMDANLPMTSAAQMAAKAERDRINAQLQHGAFYGVAGAVAGQAGGPIGGIASGGLSALAMGAGPMGIAASAAQGLVSALFDMGNSAQRARLEMENLQRGFENFVDSMGVVTGRLSSSEAQRRAAERQFQSERRAIEQAIVDARIKTGAPGRGDSPEVQALLDLLAQMDADFAKWLEAIEKNTEALTTATRNAPRGFFVEQYMGPSSASMNPWGGNPLVTTGANLPSVPQGTTPRPAVGNITFNVTSGDPQVMLRMIVAELRQLGLASDGVGATPTDVLNLYS